MVEQLRFGLEYDKKKKGKFGQRQVRWNLEVVRQAEAIPLAARSKSGSAAGRLLGLRVQIPAGGMDACIL